MSGVLPLEPHIDEMTQYFCQRLEENFICEPSATKACNLGKWIALCEYSLFLDTSPILPGRELMPCRYLGRSR